MQLNHWNWKKVILIHGEKGSAAIKIYDFSRNISLHFAAAASINSVALLDPECVTTCTGNFTATVDDRVKYSVYSRQIAKHNSAFLSEKCILNSHYEVG
jgi:hypothetical protein